MRCITILAALAAWAVLPLGAHHDGWSEFAREESTRTLRFGAAAAARRVVVDNIFGSITVSAGAGRDVVAKIRKTIRAASAAAAEQAKQEVTLEIKEGGDRVELYVDGPFRERESRAGHRDYAVQYDFELSIPADCALSASTVNDGTVQVTGLSGDFDVGNVNGAIRMAGIAGAGAAHTVNGGVKIAFQAVPRTDCSLKTINGDIEAVFGRDLAADFRLKTFNGRVYSDFETTLLPQPPGTGRRHEGRFVYSGNRFSAVRVGKGGPTIALDTLNGDILIARGDGQSAH